MPPAGLGVCISGSRGTHGGGTTWCGLLLILLTPYTSHDWASVSQPLPLASFHAYKMHDRKWWPILVREFSPTKQHYAELVACFFTAEQHWQQHFLPQKALVANTLLYYVFNRNQSPVGSCSLIINTRLLQNCRDTAPSPVRLNTQGAVMYGVSSKPDDGPDTHLGRVDPHHI